MAKRNADICARYTDGATIAQLCAWFELKQMRVRQILKAGGVWNPQAKSERNEYVGVVVSHSTKEALRKRAEAEGKSVSKLASDALDEVAKVGS